MTGNIQGLYPRKNKNKMNLIADVAKQSHSIIIALTESHLRGEIRDAEVSIDGFSMIRADRSDGFRGGGVVMYIKES